MDFPQTYDNVNRYPFENPRAAAHWGSEGNTGENLFAGDDQIQELQPFITPAAQHDAAFSCHLPAYWGQAAGRPDPSSLILSDIENQLLGDSFVSFSEEGNLLARSRSMCSVLEPQKVSNFLQNIGVNNVGYGQATYVHDTGINERLVVDNAFPYVQPIHSLPPQVFDGTPRMSYIPTENNPYGFHDPTAADYDVVDASHEVRR